MQLALEDLLCVLDKRDALIACIDQIIENSFLLAPKRRLKRGVVQSFLCDAMDVTPNTFLRQLINERMNLKGYKSVKVQGDHYYRDITSVVGEAHKSSPAPK